MNLGLKIYNRLPTTVRSYIGTITGNTSGSKSVSKNLGRTSMNIPLQRLVQSIANWRGGTNEAEYYLPFRVIQQQLYNDIIDEPHVAACMERRMDLTLLRDYTIQCPNEADTIKWTDWLKNSPWFVDYQRFGLTALFRGYTLVSLGDIVSNETMTNGLPELKMLEHSLVSPDRKNFASVIYAVEGPSWEDKEYKPWHIYFSTPTQIGNGAVGYGILHKIAVPAILLRANLTDNANYNEKFGMPVTWGKTHKTSNERDDFFDDLRNMGASATFVTDLEDELEFLMPAGSGQGYKTYPDLEARCQKLVSKNILGHADVMDSIPKRSGGAEGNSQTPTTPVQAALSDIKSKDGSYLTPYNNLLLDKLRAQGVPIPKGAKFCYKNDEEEERAKNKELDNQQKYATIAKTMKDAGLQIDPKTFTDNTGIPCKGIAEVVKTNPLPTEIKNKLNLLYK